MNFKQQTDTYGDILGLTPLHYATIRGSTICCLHIIENSALSSHQLLFKQCLKGNTPLSLAIYYISDTCLLTLLKQISGTDEKFSLKSYYHHENNVCTNDIKLSKEPMCWSPKTFDKNLYPMIKQTLYELILANNWEGINWLILENLEKYGLTRLDTIFYSIKADNYSLALRLIEKHEKNAQNSIEFYQELLTQQDLDTKRTLLHILCLKPADTSNKNEAVLIKIMNKLFLNQNTELKNYIKDFYLLKDIHNCTAIHYACIKHNFLILDYLFKVYTENPQDLLTSKDGLEQTAFALLFWSIGRVEFTVDIKEKILYYYKTYLQPVNNDSKRLNDSIKAYYNLIDLNNFGYINKLDVVNDYPNEAISGGKLMLNPLLFAINRQDLEMCKYLVKQLNFDVNSYDGIHIPAIVYAIRVNNTDLVRVLLNLDYSLEDKHPKVKPNEAVTVTNGLFGIFNAKPVEEEEKMDDDDDDDDEEEEKKSTKMDLDETPEPQPTINNDILNPTKFQIQTNINLFHLDSESRSIFHHLACTLDYGSYSNLNICKLLLYCKKKFEASGVQNQLQIEQQQNYFNEELRQIIKHLDKKSNTAIDYSIKYGNYELADELRKFLNRDQPQSTVKLPTFYVNDPYYAGPNAIHDYKYDSDELLRKLKANDETSNDLLLFKVDENSQMNKNGEIYYENNQPFDCLLTKTDITYGLVGMHNFYKMQLIRQKFLHVNNFVDQTDADASLYILFTRWGRIGTVGQFQRTPFPSLDEAKAEFLKIFKQKTGNDFNDVVLKNLKKFDFKTKKYNLITFEMRSKIKLSDLNFNLPTTTLIQLEQAVATGETIECKIKNLEYIKFFLDLCDSSYLKRNASRDTHVAFDFIPLTRLSRQMIENAFDILTNEIKVLIDERCRIEKEIVQNKTKELLSEYMSLIDNLNVKSNKYYQLMPQFGYEFDKLKPIDNQNDYEKQLSLILQLTDYQYAIKILMGAFNSLKTINPIDYIYNSINCKLQYLNENEAESQYILRYIWSSSKNFDTSSKVTVERIFKFEHVGGGEELALVKKSECQKQATNQNRVLLWHGTSSENMLSIMSKGLIKCPFESQKNGSRYGKGIYSSDVFMMSAGYSNGKVVKPECDSDKVEYERKYMLLCEVSLGKVYEITNPRENVENTPEGYDSVKAVGKYEPNEQYTIQLPNGSKLPLGNVIESKLNDSNLQKNIRSYDKFNQYVVYDDAQVCIRYIVQFRQMK
jgi:predicted DNA-binding WGR domain protein